MASDIASVGNISVCIAIPTYNRGEILVKTIEQVLSQRPCADEVLIVDQTPVHDRATERYLREKDVTGKLRWIRHGPPNLPSARNRALRECSCDVLLFIDDDVQLAPGFVGRHRRNYADREVVAVAGKVIQANGWSYPARSRKWPRKLDYRFFRLDGSERKEWIASFVGCNHSVRSEAMRRLGGYDENYIGSALREDTDAALRIWKAGGKIVFDPAASLLHLAAPSGGCRIRSKGGSIEEWKVSFPASYFAMRHLFPGREFWWDIFAGNVRKYVLRKNVALRPWKLPWALGSYCYSAVRGIRCAKERSAQEVAALRALHSRSGGCRGGERG
jgi:GT2 family glycosyltransferase